MPEALLPSLAQPHLNEGSAYDQLRSSRPVRSKATSLWHSWTLQRIEECEMKKIERQSKVRARMISNTHDSEFTDQTDDTAGRTADGVEDASQGDKTVLRKVADYATSAARGAYTNATGATGVAARRVRADGRKVWEVTASSACQVMASAQALLPDSIASDLNRMFEGTVQGSATIYDKAMDANYLDPLLKADLSGSYHRLFDGGHTTSGAFNAVRDASSDDTIIQEAMGTIRGLLRDVTTIRGLPLANWNKETFERVAGALESKFHIPRDWF